MIIIFTQETTLTVRDDITDITELKLFFSEYKKPKIRYKICVNALLTETSVKNSDREAFPTSGTNTTYHVIVDFVMN